MRTLVISDVHGNIDALQAIDEKYDNVICIGDIVDYGPSPAECVEFLRERKLHRARGNHDHAVAFCQDCRTPGAFFHNLSTASREFTVQALDDAQKKWLGDVETFIRTEHDGLRIFAAHGAPSDHMYKYLLPGAPDEVFMDEIAAAEADIVFVGHTHQPYIKKLDGKMLVNVGSVGQPRDGISQACYAVLEDGEVEIKRAVYDVAAAVAKTRKMPLDETVREQLVHLLENARPPVPKK